jgi:hypothetical protein
MSNPTRGSTTGSTTTAVACEDAPLTRFHLWVTTAGTGGQFSDGFIVGIVGIVIAAATNTLQLTPLWVGLLGAATLTAGQRPGPDFWHPTGYETVVIDTSPRRWHRTDRSGDQNRSRGAPAGDTQVTAQAVSAPTAAAAGRVLSPPCRSSDPADALHAAARLGHELGPAAGIGSK